jgi:hypothetical protein
LILSVLYEKATKEELLSIFKNLIYMWKNSKKRSKILLLKLKADAKSLDDASLLKELE